MDQTRKDHNYTIVDDSINVNRVNIGELTKCITQQVHTFFQIKSNKKAATKSNFYATKEDGDILVRIEGA